VPQRAATRSVSASTCRQASWQASAHSSKARSALDSAEMDTVDLRFGLRGDQARPEGIVLVAIDGPSLQELGKLPLRRRLHARALDRLRRAGARAIVYDVQFTEPSASPSDDNALFDAVRRAADAASPTMPGFP